MGAVVRALSLCCRGLRIRCTVIAILVLGVGAGGGVKVVTRGIM